MRSTIRDVASLQLILKLAAAGMEVGPGTMPASVRLSILGRHQESWDSLKFTDVKDFGSQSGR
jgi:hypothetical protein